MLAIAIIVLDFTANQIILIDIRLFLILWLFVLIQ